MQLDDYILTQFIGKGSFGEVYLTKKKDSDFLFATKRMPKDLVENPKYSKYFNNEILILRKLYHKNIIKLEALKKTKNHYYVIMEYCNGGTLNECLEKYKLLYHRPFTEEIVQCLMRQIVSAVNYIHELKIIHRDLKLDNILVKFENEEDKNKVNLLKSEIKIIDFGFSAHKDQSGLLTTAIGSPLNMDPIILKKFNSNSTVNKELGYDEKADLWSLGTLCYQMLIGNSTFDAYNLKELALKIEEGDYKVPTNLSKEVVSFLNAMLQYKPEKRLASNKLIRHAFLIKDIKDFSKIDLNKVSNKVYGGELKINIKNNNTIWSIFNEEDEQKLNNIPEEILATETPISESQYLGNLNNGNNEMLITKEPFNIEKNFLDKEFKTANSTPIEGLSFTTKSFSGPEKDNSSEISKVQNNSNNQNEENNKTPMKIPVFQQNNNNNFNPKTPQISGKENMKIEDKIVTITGQIFSSDVHLGRNNQIKKQVSLNNQNKNEQINMNLMNKFQQTPEKEIVSNNLNGPQQNNFDIMRTATAKQIIPKNIYQNQMNLMNNPQLNLKGQIQNQNNQGLHQQIGLPSTNKEQKIQPNQNLQKQMSLNQNPNRQLQINQQNQIKNNNQYLNNQLINNQFQRNQMQNNPNKLINNNQIHTKQISNNIIQNNQLLNKQIQNKNITIQNKQNINNKMKADNNIQNNQIQNRQISNIPIQNKQAQNIIFPQNQIQNQNAKNLNNPNIINKIPNNLQYNQSNISSKIKNNLGNNLPQQLLQNPNQPNQIYKAIQQNKTVQQPSTNQIKTPLQVGQCPIKPQINLNQNNINQINQGPINQIQKIQKVDSQQNKTIGIPLANQKVCSDKALNKFKNTLNSNKNVPKINQPILKIQTDRTGNQVNPTPNPKQILIDRGRISENNLVFLQRPRIAVSPFAVMRPVLYLQKNN